jgi:hypothetical protein
MAWPKGKQRKGQKFVTHCPEETVVDTVDEVLADAPEGEVITFEDPAAKIEAQIEHVAVEIAKAEASGTSISPDIAALLAGMQAQMLAAVAEMRKPSESEQRKLDEEAKRRATIALMSARAAKMEEEQTARMQATCQHSKPDGTTAFIAQVNSDSCYRPYCPYCKYISRPIRAQEWQKAEGLNLRKMKGLTIPMLERMADASLPPIPMEPVPLGMVADLSNY